MSDVLEQSAGLLCTIAIKDFIANSGTDTDLLARNIQDILHETQITNLKINHEDYHVEAFTDTRTKVTTVRITVEP